MTLNEFLAQTAYDNGTTIVDVTALGDATALAEAQAYKETQGKMIARNTMNSMLAMAGLYNTFLAAAGSNDLIAAFMDGSSTEYNFIQGNATGDAQIAALDQLIASGQFAGLDALKPTIIARANTTVYPFANATLEQVKAIRHPASWQEAIYVGGNDKVVSTSVDKDSFEFRVDANIPELKVRISYSEGFGEPYSMVGQTFTIRNSQGVADWTDYINRRDLARTLKGGRWIKFETLANDSETVYTVNITPVSRV